MPYKYPEDKLRYNREMKRRIHPPQTTKAEVAAQAFWRTAYEAGHHLRQWSPRAIAAGVQARLARTWIEI